MTLSKRSKRISLAITILSLLLLIVVYLLTDEWVIMILFIPPISHWILEKREKG